MSKTKAFLTGATWVLNKWEYILKWGLNVIRMGVLPNLWIECNSSNDFIIFLLELKTVIKKSFWRNKYTRIAKKTLKKKKGRRANPTDIKTYQWASIIQAASLRRKAYMYTTLRCHFSPLQVAKPHQCDDILLVTKYPPGGRGCDT